MTTALLILLVWTLTACAVGPLVGRRLKRIGDASMTPQLLLPGCGDSAGNTRHFLSRCVLPVSGNWPDARGRQPGRIRQPGALAAFIQRRQHSSIFVDLASKALLFQQLKGDVNIGSRTGTSTDRGDITGSLQYAIQNFCEGLPSLNFGHLAVARKEQQLSGFGLASLHVERRSKEALTCVTNLVSRATK